MEQIQDIILSDQPHKVNTTSGSLHHIVFMNFGYEGAKIHTIINF